MRLTVEEVQLNLIRLDVLLIQNKCKALYSLVAHGCQIKTNKFPINKIYIDSTVHCYYHHKRTSERPNHNFSRNSPFPISVSVLELLFGYYFFHYILGLAFPTTNHHIGSNLCNGAHKSLRESEMVRFRVRVRVMAYG